MIVWLTVQEEIQRVGEIFKGYEIVFSLINFVGF